MEELKWFSTLGVGGVLAGVMFWFYRIDRKETEAKLFQLLDRMRELYVSEQGRNDNLIDVVKENTHAVTQLSSLIQNHIAKA